MSDAAPRDQDAGPLDDERLISVLRKEEQAASNWQGSELSGIRQKALDYYDRQPTGDEEDGQSKVVTSEFADTVESIMPSMMRVFASGEDVVEFTPIEEADEQWARQASQYVPHVLMRENEGFRIIHDFIKDALMHRLSGANVDVEEVEKARRDPIEHWTGEQLALAEQLAREAGADDVELDVESDVEPPGPPDPEADLDRTGPDQPMLPAPQETFSGAITTTRKKKRVVVDGIAPEDILITPGARNQRVASFQGYRKQVSASDLRVMGVDQEEIEALSSDRPTSSEEDQRQDGQTIGNNRKDSERRLWLVVAYVKVDADGDGISEMLRVVYAHAGGDAAHIIERMEWDDGEAPIALGTPILMPHTIVGRSLFDQTQDLQDVGTALTRGMLDNIYLTNRPRPAINSRVNINSVIDWTPGMPIQVQGNENPGASIAWLQVPSIIAAALSGMQHFDGVREKRTGVTAYNQGMDADSLNKTMGGIDRIMSAAEQRQDLMARVFAATGITQLMRHIYRAVRRAASGPVKYPVGDEWAECDPTKWPDDMHLIVTVGMGTGNKERQLQNLAILGQAQEKLAKNQGGLPIVTPKHAANTVRKMAEAMGFRATSQFVASAKEIEQAPPQQPQASPEMEKVRADAAAAQAKFQADNALAQQKLQAEIQLKRESAQADMQIAREKNALDMQLAREKAQLDAQLKQQELHSEAQLRAVEIATTPRATPNIVEQQVTG